VICRYKFVLEYDGSKFDSGWQRQREGLTSVQSTFEEALYELTKEKVKAYCAGRTDKGVHALSQIAHCDFSKPYPLKMLHDGTNSYLRTSGCRVRSVAPVDQLFHARFNAKAKTYQYIISWSRICSVFDLDRVWWINISTSLDIELMQKEMTSLLGYHDFSSFRDSSCQAASPMRSIEIVRLEIEDGKLIFTFGARSFLHKQIRIMVGTLIDIGRGKLCTTVADILQAKDRSAAGQTAPGCGLYLKSIEYEDVKSISPSTCVS
jgi:tRNA pseudouridine38-40 synthase